MEWYFGNGTDELLVPRDREVSDRWMQWGISGTESFNSPNKYFVTETKPTGDIDFNHKSFSDAVDMDYFTQERDQSCSSTVCGDLSFEAPTFRTGMDQSEYQFDNLGESDQTDEIFLSSLLEEDQPGGDATLDTGSGFSNFHSTEDSRYQKKDLFSEAIGWEDNEINTSQRLPFDLVEEGSGQRKRTQAFLVKDSDASEENNIDEHMDGDRSPEECTLHELETVIYQMTENTRICFRDALFRLAKNSRRQKIVESQNGNLELGKALHFNDGTSRSRRENESESETNTIDRTVASLMFNNMDYHNEDHSAAVYEQGTVSEIAPTGYISQRCLGPDSLPMLQGDAEVPTFAQMITD